MDSIQDLIISTYNEKPKHFSQILKKNKNVLNYIKDNVPIEITNFLEQIYYVVYKDNGICKYGNKKKLKSFEGFSFCGKTGSCTCAKESVSNNVSQSKKSLTQEQIELSNLKREQTSLKKYGVKNNGQIQNALNAHKEFYLNKDKVSEVTVRIKNTKLKKYGSSTFNNREKAEQTCIEKYGIKNVCVFSEDNKNPNLDILKNKEELSKFFPKMSVTEIAKKLNVWEGTVYRYLNQHGFREPYKSTFEQEIVSYLNTLGIYNIETNKRTIIGKELDIFLPDYNLAIEYNGVYWHHDKIPHITKSYHYDKFINCEKNNIELLTIFSDSWENKKGIWKEKIKAKLHLSEKKIYARKTYIKELKISETKDFLNNNHIQGYCVSQIAYGLYYENNLVAIMTFSKNRIGFGNKFDENIYELVRYVTDRNVIGGASKLLKHFLKKHNPNKIISYSDNQYSVGNLYKKLGFSLKNENKCGYWYYDPFNKKMYHRYNFAKHLLVEEGFDPSKTEKEIMDERGFLRIWDCGSRTWSLTIK